jgi:putative MATE family efflux protein
MIRIKKHQSTLINDLTVGPVAGRLLLFALPLMFSNLLQTLYMMVDMVVVGKFVGTNCLSAVSIASQLIFLLTMVGMAFSSSGQILISQIVGSKKTKELNSTIGTLFSSLGILSLLFLILVVIFRDSMLAIMNTPPESLKSANDYMLITGLGIPFIFGYNVVGAILRGMGDSKRPLVFVAIASVMNIVLDLIFVAVFHLDAAGAALATIISQAASFIIAMVYLYGKREQFGFDFKLRSLKIDRSKLGLITKLGIPISLQYCAINLSMLFVNSFINSYGVTASALVGSGRRMEQIPGIVTMAIGQSASVMIGQNFAAGKFERIKRIVAISCLTGFVTYLAYGIYINLFPKTIFLLFTDDPDVLELASLFITSITVAFPALAFMTPFMAVINGIGHARLSLLAGILDGVVARVALALLLGITLGFGFKGFLYGTSLAAYVNTLVCCIYYFSGYWKKRSSLVARAKHDDQSGDESDGESGAAAAPISD